MNSLINEDIFQSDSEIIIVPFSNLKTISTSFKKPLETLGLSIDFKKQEYYNLGDVEFVRVDQHKTLKYIAYVCTVNGKPKKESYSYYSVIRNIGKKLSAFSNENDIRSVSTPLLGTGVGQLKYYWSWYIFNSTFMQNTKYQPILDFYVLDTEIYEKLKIDISKKYSDINIPSGQLVIEAEISNIRANEYVDKIQNSKEFYFQLAIDKFNEYIEYKPSNIKEPLLGLKVLTFYADISEQFNSSQLTFKEFINSDLSKEQLEFTTLCGELVAYIDYNAYHKNIWNKYPDKRILAKSLVRQNVWFLNLIKYKQTNDLNSLSLSIRNALKYLKSPNNNLTMLSENHRKKVHDNLFPNRPYSNDEFIEVLYDFFSRLDINPYNSNNLGVLYSRILYLPFIKSIWDEAIIKESTLKKNTKDTDLNKISTLIEECLKTKSKALDLGNCGLTDLAIIPELFECNHIEILILSNEWAEYKDGKWRKLTSKNKGQRNNLESLPDSIRGLTELRELICGGDWNENVDKTWNRWGIKTLTPISGLEKLEYLNLSNNQLNSLVGLNKLTKLKVAHLNNNEVSRVATLTNLVHLKELYLSNNKIKNVDFIAKLPNIETLDLHHNQIKDLRPIKSIIEKIGISNDKWEVNTLNVANNPLEQPPMTVVMLGKESVLGMFDDIEKRGKYINKEVKVILAGNSEVGKSTLLKYLDKETGLNEKHLSTTWMDEKIINSKSPIATIEEECLLHVFDFGGHDYYHDTHQLFYGSNTIYILLWDQGTNKLALRNIIQENKDGEEVEIETQDYPLKYWLDSIKFHIKDFEVDNFDFVINKDARYNSSLLLIQNKVANASDIVFLDNQKLSIDYPFIYDIINVSIRDPKRNLDHFDALLSEMLNNMQIIGAVLPKFYEPIKKSISTYKEKPILLFSEFFTYCNNILKEPINENQCRRLVQYLKQVGAVLYIKKEDKEKIYLDKKWIIDNMHKILEKLTEEKGKFDMEYVKSKVGADTDNMIDDILMMMQEFKMIFKHPYLETFIAPLYLPKIPDGKISLFLDKKNIPFRRFEYNGFIHKNVILSIFQEFGTLYPLDKNKEIYYYWKDGLIIKSLETEEIIMIKFNLGNDDGNACIDIYELTNSDKPNFREEIVKYIIAVNKGYDLEEMVTLNGIDYISKKILEKNASIGKYVFSEKKLSDLQKSKNQDKLFKLKDYMKFIDNPIKKKKVVISYSKKDIEHVHTLRRYLQSLIDAELIDQPWFCTHLNPGDDWDQKIKSKFIEADIIFFMVSDYFYSTQYIIDKEIKTAIDRYDNGDCVKIIPIIIEFYDWARKEPYNLQRFSALPYQAKPISDFKNPKIAWNTITASVKMMIEKDLDPSKIELIGRDLEEIYERQVKGKLDNNSN